MIAAAINVNPQWFWHGPMREPDPAETAARYGAETPRARSARAARLFALRQPPDRHGGYWGAPIGGGPQR